MEYYLIWRKKNMEYYVLNLDHVAKWTIGVMGLASGSWVLGLLLLVITSFGPVFKISEVLLFPLPMEFFTHTFRRTFTKIPFIHAYHTVSLTLGNC